MTASEVHFKGKTPDSRQGGYRHVPVMTAELMRYLDCQPGKVYVDCTLGGAGHARSICQRITPDGVLVALDQDPAALQNAKTVLAPYLSQVHLQRGNFAELDRHLSDLGIRGVDGIVADLGVSLYQLTDSGRGFSFQQDEPLDMRMDPSRGTPASELVNRLSRKELADILKSRGEERYAGRIAKQIVRARQKAPLRSSRQLAELVARAVPEKGRSRIHPATRTFMALRIAVNQELESLDRFLRIVPDLLNPEGRFCVLAFHSLEDRMVKQYIRHWEKDCVCPPGFPQCVCDKQRRMRALTRKPLQPGQEEVQSNPMSRSTRMRAAKKL